MSQLFIYLLIQVVNDGWTLHKYEDDRVTSKQSPLIAFSFSMTTMHLKYLQNGIPGYSTFEKMVLPRILCLPKLHHLGKQYVLGQCASEFLYEH